MSIKKSQSYLVDSLCDQLSVWLNTQLISKVILSYTHKCKCLDGKQNQKK